MLASVTPNLVFAALFLGLAVASPLSAQTFAGGTIGGSSQSAGDNDRPYLGPAFGGSAPSGTVFVDQRLRPRLIAGIEVSLAGNIEGNQSQRAGGGNNIFTARHHDTVFSGVVKAAVIALPRFEFSAVGGLGGALRRTERAGIFQPTFNSNTRPFKETLTDLVPAITAGIEASVSVAARLSIVGAGRIHYLLDNDRGDDGAVDRGVGSVLVRYGGGVKFRF